MYLGYVFLNLGNKMSKYIVQSLSLRQFYIAHLPSPKNCGCMDPLFHWLQEVCLSLTPSI
jgi:hypothetical protein